LRTSISQERPEPRQAYVSAYLMSLHLYGTPAVMREAERKPPGLTRAKKGTAWSCGAIEHNHNAMARLR